MTEKIDPNQDDEANAGGDLQELSVEEIKAENAALKAEAAKNRALAKKAFAERDDFKAKAKTTQDADLKALYEEATSANAALLSRAKAGDVKSALAAQLAKAGCVADAMGAASKLIDMDVIEWSLEEGVDSTSVTAAVAKLKRENAFMFEKAISRTDPKQPVDGSAHNANEMKRSDFDKLDAYAKHAAATKKGFKITD